MIRSSLKKLTFEHGVVGLYLLAGTLGILRIAANQKIIWVANGLGWDGVHYQRLLEFFAAADGAAPRAGFPFCGRIGTPWLLANVFGGRVGFYEFNIVVSVVFVGALLYASRPLWSGSLKGLSAAVTVSAFLYFAPIRFVNFYPAYMDPPSMLVLAVCLVFILRQAYFVAALICLAGIPFKEASFYLLPLMLGFGILNSQHRQRAALGSFGILLAGYALKLLMLSVADCEGESQMATAFYWLYEFLTQPTRALAAMAAISLTLGPVLVIADKDSLAGIRPDHKAFAAVAAVYTAILSVIGGADVTRIFYSFSPLYIALLIGPFSRAPLSAYALACLGWLTTNQMLNKFEQPAGSWPKLDTSGFFAQFPDHADPVVALSILGIWLTLAATSRAVRRVESDLT